MWVQNSVVALGSGCNTGGIACDGSAVRAMLNHSPRLLRRVAARSFGGARGVSTAPTGVRPISGLSAAHQERIYSLATKQATGISLRQLYRFGLPAMPDCENGELGDESAYRKTLVDAGKFLYHELPIR
jgi:hypothetical protein